MSSLWFKSTASAEVKHADPEELDLAYSAGLMSILAAIGNQLDILQPESLLYDEYLGKGSSFEVSRQFVTRVTDKDWEPHYVAVKRIVVSEDSQGNVQRQFDSIMRELRVLTHPGLKSNSSIVSILAYGWARTPTRPQPYLVMQYSNHGTLDEYLRRVEPSLEERHKFAQDVAIGLKAVHDSKIIHGDMKPHNVLVFDSIEQQRNQIAKIADFGGSIFELDKADATAYSGTTLYRAQEPGRRSHLGYDTLYQADIYALGITIWEIAKNGCSYIETDWLGHGETRKDFLQRVWMDGETDAILRRAEEFLSSLDRECGLTVICKAILETFRLTLRDDGDRRAAVGEVVKVLSLGSISATKSRLPPVKQSIRSTSTNGSEAFSGYKLKINASGNLDIRTQGPWLSNEEGTSSGNLGKAESRVTTLIRPNPAASVQYKPAGLDIFQVLTKHSRAREGYFDACLQLALCYHVGYGVKPDMKDMLHYLTMSLEGQSVTRAIYKRVILALAPSSDRFNIESNFQTQLDLILNTRTTRETYFAERVRMYQLNSLIDCKIQLNQDKQLGGFNLINIISFHDATTLCDSLHNRAYSEEELSAALALACRQGRLYAAIELCRYLGTFLGEPGAPTPLHWMIMFGAQEAVELIQSLVQGSSKKQPGPCEHLLDSAPSAGEGLCYLADHCLELFGTPLHWAVRTRNLNLVRMLCNLGANVNVRWRPPPPIHADVQKPTLPHLSPLDVAVQFHLPEIAETLLDFGAQWLGTSLEESHTPLHCIGLACPPFSRHILHGDDYQAALEETLAVVSQYGYDINEVDPNNYNALMIALSDCDCEPYIIRGLLRAGARTDLVTEDDESNLAHIGASVSLSRPYNVECFALIAGDVPNINQLDRYGRSALHYAAITGSKPIAGILADLASIDLECKSSKGDTALHFAATFGSVDVLLLMIQNGASIEALNATGKTALQLAVLNRRREATEILLASGADVSFASTELSLGGNILHAAATGIRSEETMVSDLLMKYAKLRSAPVLNGTNSEGWTPLHKSAYFGDYDAVTALLHHGAVPTLRGQRPWRRTPLDLATQVHEKAKSGTLGPDHKRISQQPLHMRRKFIAGMEEIIRLLKDSGGSKP
ncbi:MAG: hypothetical protein Q9218_001411 [Villophora microphyllina]